jgi:hypothetical protein
MMRQEMSGYVVNCQDTLENIRKCQDTSGNACQDASGYVRSVSKSQETSLVGNPAGMVTAFNSLSLI